jgi:drug/metabolite transporter (DMT)-like permease
VASKLSVPVVAGGFALLAALIWSTYYFFTLNLQARGVGEGPITAVPFLSGGVAYLFLVLANRRTRELGQLARQPESYLRSVLLIGMQLLVIVGTFSLGAVDTSLLTLVGDVVATPLLVLAIFGEGHDRLRSHLFVAGVAISVAGATLSIVAGGATHAASGGEWLVAVGVPLTIAAYFIWTARAGRERPTEVLVTQATLGAALLGFLIGPWLPGSDPAIWLLSPPVLLLLTVNGLLTFFVAPWLYFRAIALAGILLPSVLMATIPVFTLLLAILLVGSIPPLLGAIGIPLAVGGALLAVRGEASVSARRA